MDYRIAEWLAEQEGSARFWRTPEEIALGEAMNCSQRDEAGIAEDAEESILAKAHRINLTQEGSR